MTDAKIALIYAMPRGGKTKTSGQGRPKGVPNKLNTDIRAMILGALDAAGGVEYLTRQADENPSAFMSLVGRVLPTKIEADVAVRSYVMRAPLPIESAEEWLRQHAPSDSRTIEAEAMELHDE